MRALSDTPSTVCDHLFLVPYLLSVMVEQLSSKHNLSLKSMFNNTRGFYMQTTPTDAKKGGGGLRDGALPDEFIKVVRHKNTISFTTHDLLRLNGEYWTAESEMSRLCCPYSKGK